MKGNKFSLVERFPLSFYEILARCDDHLLSIRVGTRFDLVEFSGPYLIFKIIMEKGNALIPLSENYITPLFPMYIYLRI